MCLIHFKTVKFGTLSCSLPFLLPLLSSPSFPSPIFLSPPLSPSPSPFSPPPLYPSPLPLLPPPPLSPSPLPFLPPTSPFKTLLSPPPAPPHQATDHRGLTPLLSTFRNGHTELVDWLLGHVTHLPSDLECQKALMAPTPPDTDLLPQRSKCLEMIMKVENTSLKLKYFFTTCT